jgi:hypothetical protein
MPNRVASRGLARTGELSEAHGGYPGMCDAGNWACESPGEEGPAKHGESSANSESAIATTRPNVDAIQEGSDFVDCDNAGAMNEMRSRVPKVGESAPGCPVPLGPNEEPIMRGARMMDGGVTGIHVCCFLLIANALASEGAKW